MGKHKGRPRSAASRPHTKDRVKSDVPREVRLYAQLGLRMPAEIAVRLKQYCQESGKSVNKAVMQALVRYLDSHGY